MGRMLKDGKVTRDAAIQSLVESQRCGHSKVETLRRLSKILHMGTPATRSVRDYLIRSGRVALAQQAVEK
jgi:hypothetical protein